MESDFVKHRLHIIPNMEPHDNLMLFNADFLHEIVEMHELY